MSLVLGVLGGMGPAATLDFLTKLQAATPAASDQDHIRTIVDINPQVPDRNAPGADPGPVLAEMAGALEGAGAQVLAIACNTAHEYAGLISRAAGLPLIDMIETAVIAAEATGATEVGVIGTRAALRLYREYLAARGLKAVTADAEGQARFMDVVYRIKAGDLGETVRAEVVTLVAELKAAGAQALIAGCTELPLVYAGGGALPFIDPTEALAQRCVAVCLEREPPPAMYPPID